MHQSCFITSLCLSDWWVLPSCSRFSLSLSVILSVETSPSQMVKTTGGPALAASVASPAMTIGAVSLLQNHLIEEEKELWTSLGPYWTSSGCVFVCTRVCVRGSWFQSVAPTKFSLPPLFSLHLKVSVPPYSPVFMDGWKPQACDPTGQPFEDPVESQHKQDAFEESREARLKQDQVRQTAQPPGEERGEV